VREGEESERWSNTFSEYLDGEVVVSEMYDSVRAVFFDLDETLLDDDRCMRVAVAQTCKKLAERYPQIAPEQLEATYLRVSNGWWTDSGSVPRASVGGTSDGKAIRTEVWGKSLSACGLVNKRMAIEAAGIYSQGRKATYRLFPDVDEVLNTLHKTFVLGVITNGPDTQREKIDSTSLTDYMDVVIISGEVGVGKPDPGIFTRALISVQVSPREAIYVGDSLTWDIGGAKNAGLYSVWINRNRMRRPHDAAQPDVEITTLRDLIPILGLNKD
jgi:HAD superfamily hydrolase (TIGR02253 family)